MAVYWSVHQGMVESEIERLTRYRRGDMGAMEELVEKYRRPLFSVILNMVRDAGEADEVFQEAWFRVIRNLNLYTEKNFFGWLVRIARNLIIDRIRRRRPDMSLDEAPEGMTPLSQTLAGPDADPEQQLERDDLCRAVAGALDSLPTEQKEVFLMRVQAGLPFKEIARIQKVSINTALARMQYALSKLRPLLKEYEDM
jgi:RNA polymerase sigma-70 factor (ECF subfamily)